MDIESREEPREKKGFISRIIKLLVIAGLIFGLYYGYQYLFGDNNENQENDTQTEENKSNLNATEVEIIEINSNPLSRINFKKVGTVTAYKSSTLTAETSGMLQNFNFEEGDSVEKDEKIAEISDSVSTEIARINYETTLKGLENAKEAYKNTSNSVAQDIKTASIGAESAKLNYENAKLVYENLEKSLEEQIRSAKIGVQAAQLALQKAQETYFNTYSTTGINLQNTLDQSLNGVNSALSLVDSSVDAANSLLSMQSSLGGNVKSSKINNLKDYSEDIFDEYLDLKDKYEDNYDDRDFQRAQNLLEETIYLTEEAQSMLRDAKDIIDDAGNPSDFSTLNTSCSTLLSSMDQSKSSLGIAKQTLYSMQINSQVQPEGTMTGVEMAQQQLTAAIQQLNQLEEAKKAQLDSANHAIEMALKQANSAKAQYLSTISRGNLQKISADNQVSSVEGQTEIAKANLGSTTLEAPFKGILTQKFLEEGNYVSPSQKILTIADLSKVYITVSLTAEELSFVKLGQGVTVTAPGEIKKEGKVSKVLPTLDPISKKIDVKILISNEDNNLIPGMFADVEFQDAQTQTQRLLIPFKSILFEQNQSYVYIVQNNKAFRTKVELGETAGEEVEVTDGLSQGDKIITTGAKIVKDGDAVTSQ